MRIPICLPMLWLAACGGSQPTPAGPICGVPAVTDFAIVMDDGTSSPIPPDGTGLRLDRPPPDCPDGMVSEAPHLVLSADGTRTVRAACVSTEPVHVDSYARCIRAGACEGTVPDCEASGPLTVFDCRAGESTLSGEQARQYCAWAGGALADGTSVRGGGDVCHQHTRIGDYMSAGPDPYGPCPRVNCSRVYGLDVDREPATAWFGDGRPIGAPFGFFCALEFDTPASNGAPEPAGPGSPAQPQ